MNSISLAIAELIKLKSVLEGSGKELSDVLSKVRRIIPDVKTRVQRSYAWLMFVTLKVHYTLQRENTICERCISTRFWKQQD